MVSHLKSRKTEVVRMLKEEVLIRIFGLWRRGSDGRIERIASPKIVRSLSAHGECQRWSQAVSHMQHKTIESQGN
jgi:hypothetical protein